MDGSFGWGLEPYGTAAYGSPTRPVELPGSGPRAATLFQEQTAPRSGNATRPGWDPYKEG